MRVLVADDDDIGRMVITRLLSKWGHETVPAKDGEEAWDLFQKNPARIVITDWSMPKLSGLELCDRIRSNKFSHYVYIIILTSREGKENTVEALGAGADDFMSKPIDSAELNARLRVGLRIIQLEEEQQQARIHLLQSEKMASVGQLAAGVAHEINNPTGFVSSNLKTLGDYLDDLAGLVRKYKEFCQNVHDDPSCMTLPLKDQLHGILEYEQRIDLDYILEDTNDLIQDCREGTERIKKIVNDLKDFAHPDEDEVKPANINQGLESTLNVVWNEIKYKAEVFKDLGELPLVDCYPHRINQVFMNILVNAAQAIEEKGEIHIQTRDLGQEVEIKIRDTGKGISEEHLAKIYDPFFTTKEVGKGTGLGLNMAYNIINTHGGSIKCESAIGRGTTFILRIPIAQNRKEK
ncbi:response regulator [Desulfatibacillum aliphaticivorans]|uniref:response regulator n=1 Tax=Desulfatibacillum aliphaticivorans TaxID=218208 RepID=UPI000427ED83|nr:response regulator [Desulfatibacillum aliphaticivorans]